MKKFNRGLLLTIPVLLLLIGVAVGYHYFFERYEYPNFKGLKNIRFEQVKLKPQLILGFSADAIFHNPAPFGVEITGLNSEIYVDGKKATTIRQEINTEMPATADFSLPLQFEIPLTSGNLIKDLGDVLNGSWKKKSIHIRAAGTIGISKAKMEMEIPFEQADIYYLKDYFQ